MKEFLSRAAEQGWTIPKLAGSGVLLLVAIVGTFFLPSGFLDWAREAIGRDEAKSAFWKEWSFGLVVLGPSLFTASILAIASQFPPASRWVARLGALALTGGIYWKLFELDELRTSILVGSVGVVYSLIADGFTPSSSGTAATDDEPTEDGESAQAVAEADKPVAVADSVLLKPRSQASQVGSLITPLVLLVVPVVAIVLDVRDLAVRNWRGASRKSR